MIRVVLVDGQRLVLDGMRSVIEDGGVEVVGTAVSAAEGLAIVASTIPDVVVLDLQLPDRHGCELIAKIRGVAPEAKAVVVTAHAHPMSVARAMQARIGGYVVKTSGVDELIMAISAANAGSLHLDGPALAALQRWSLEPASLTDMEIQILRFSQAGLSRQAIADELAFSLPSIKRFLAAIMLKLGTNGTKDSVREASERGLI